MNADASKPRPIPKLPPLPRKGNRTIYLADDALWEKAKTFAGKEGISSVIARALTEFVAQRGEEDASCQRFHFEIVEVENPENTLEVIGFEGRLLLSTRFDLVVSPFEQDGKPVAAEIEIYRTKLGTFILLARPTSDEPESASAFSSYEKHNSVRALMSGLVVGCMHPFQRHELLNELTKKLGKDAVTWID